jgi:hypothetical protein
VTLDTGEAAVRVPCDRCEGLVTIRLRLVSLETRGGRVAIRGDATRCEHDVDTACRGPVRTVNAA